MKPENGIKERMVKRNNIGDDKEIEEIEESEGTEQFIIVTERQSWQEVTDIIAEKGFIKGIKFS